MVEIERKLPINLDSFGFVIREKRSGKTVKNRCGRDFLYYSLHYFLPEEFNPKICGPLQIEERGLFGLALPSYLVWTCLPFYKIPRHLKNNNLDLRINGCNVKSFPAFIRAMMWPEKIKPDRALKSIEQAIDRGLVAGIDISIGLNALNDHVMFVFGYDSENLYVFDTHKTDKINYQKLTPENDQRFIMKLPKKEISDKWTRWGRVWVIEKLS